MMQVDDQIGIVERRAIGVHQRITELAAFMDRSGRLRRDVTGDAVGPGELAEQPLQAVPAALDIRIALRIGPFEIAVRHQPRTAMTRADDVNHVQVVLFDDPI